MMLSRVTSVGGESEGPVQATERSAHSIPCHALGPERSFTLRLEPGENIGGLFDRLARVLEGATIVDMLAFGSVKAAPAAMALMRQIFGSVGWPVTWADGGACDGRSIAGIHVTVLTGGTVESIRLDDQVVGSVFEYAGARHCVLGGLGPTTSFSGRSDQAKQTFEKLEAALAQARFSIADVVRTWFFLENILSWYGEFNRVRTEVYSRVRFRTGSLPASTGVGACNPAGAALSVGARAMQSLHASVVAQEVASPLQCPAPNYGSSFSRAMEISTGAGHRLFISGTASIAPGGETLWKEDIVEQVAVTMNVVETLLRSRGFRLADVARAVAYFKHRAYLPVFTDWCADRHLSALPAALVHCDICRDDLGFEFEAEAVKAV